MAVTWKKLAYEDDVVTKALFDANTILAADSDNTPAALTIEEQRVVGRITAGNIVGLTVAQIRTLINVEDGADVTDAANVNTAGAVMESDYDAKGDILIASANDTPAILAIGTDTHVLTADSGETTGVKWAALGAPGAHDLGGASHNADTLADLNSKVSDATLDDSGDSRTPSAHAASHKDGQSDEILLHEFGQPTGAVDLNGQQPTDMVIHTVADATARNALTAVVGKIVWQTDELAVYLCTSSA